MPFYGPVIEPFYESFVMGQSIVILNFDIVTLF